MKPIEIQAYNGLKIKTRKTENIIFGILRESEKFFILCKLRHKNAYWQFHDSDDVVESDRNEDAEHHFV